VVLISDKRSLFFLPVKGLDQIKESSEGIGFSRYIFLLIQGDGKER